MKYIENISSKKAALDAIVIGHRAEPVGWGYIDTIVHRTEIESMVFELSKAGFFIYAVSWWEHLETKEQEARIGMGGPTSIFYPGWFSETPEYDETDQDTYSSILEAYDLDLIAKSNSIVLQGILGKQTKKYGEDYLAYQTDRTLTPALWIAVPDEWVNPLTKPNKVGFLPEYEKRREENQKLNLA